MTFVSRRFNQKGFALLLVLIVVSFAAVIALAFLLSARQEHSGSSAYVEGSAARQLASQAVNIVIGQINAATHEGTMAAPISWASQPGMIRTYNTQGKLSNAYKLYSWDNLIETAANFSPSAAAELPASTWSTQTSAYTDLNLPVNGVYPIADPSVFDKATTNTSFTGVTNPSGIAWDFPGEAGLLTQTVGYFPTATNTAPMPVRWLYVLQDGTWATPTNISGTTVTVANATLANPVVGRIAFWTDDETSKVNLNTAGEGAFWDTPKAGTEDELQLAANPPLQTEYHRLPGHPATTSVSAVFPELRTAASAFSRWTGTGSVNTSFASALQYIFGYGAAGSTTAHGLNPRISWGTTATSAGSQGGTYPITSYLPLYAPQVATYFSGGYQPPSTYTPPTNSDRLYASVDDAFFQPGQGTGTRSNDVAFNNAGISAKMVAQRNFFLTTDSTAPETTLYDTPRISMWPITWPYANASYYVSGHRTVPPAPATLTPSTGNLTSNPDMTYQEKLLAFCSTLNANNATATNRYPYYFQRQNPDSPTWDWNNITRNQNLVNYLDQELSDPGTAASYPTVPGIGASLGLKWDGTHTGTTDWISLTCFDYIRSMINQYTVDPSSANGYLKYSYTGVSLGGSSIYNEPDSFTTAPLNVTMNGNKYATQGTYPALREAACVFYATQRNAPRLKPAFLGVPITMTKLVDVINPANWLNLITWDPTTKTGNSQTISMQMVMLLNFSEMNPGIVTNAATANSNSAGGIYSVYHPVFWVKVSTPSGSTPFKVNNASINFPLSGGNVVQFNPINTAPMATSPGWESSLFASANGTSSTAKVFSNTQTGATVWSLVSDQITLPTAGAETFTFGGSKVQFDIYAIDPSGNINVDPTSTSQPVYSYLMDFSQWNNTNSFLRGNGNFPVPLAPYWNTRQGLMMRVPITTPPTAPTVANSAPVTDSEQMNPNGPPAQTAITGYYITGGVLMPYYSTTGTTTGTSGIKNWEGEIVWRPAPLSSVRTSSSPQQNFPWGQSRTVGASVQILEPHGESGNYTSPPPYVYQDAAWDGLQTANTTPTGTNYSSTIFEDRVRALTLNSATPSAAQAETLDRNNSYGYSISYPSAPSTTLFNDSTGFSGFTDAMEGSNVVSPYDTVISMVAEPRSTASAAAGDPRLTGRGVAGFTSVGAGNVTFSPLSSEQICGSIPTTDASNTPVDPFILAAASIFDPRSGLSTYGAQFHELDSTGPTPSLTGIKPPWQFVGPTQTMLTGSPLACKGGITDVVSYPSTTPVANSSSSFSSNGLLMGMNDPAAALGLDANALMSLQSNMDWTRQPGAFPDGGYYLRPDQEYQSVVPKASGVPLALNMPFFNDGASLSESYNSQNGTTGFFSPSRQVPSPVLLGTLPDSMVTGWQTLNFCPNPAVAMNNGVAHPGQGTPSTPISATGAAYSTAPDHLLLDLFWMPVSEPYPISSEFATAGKVNINYAMMPFPYIQRKTALDALLKSVWITAMPDPSVTPNSTGNPFAPFPQNYKSYGMLYQLNREDLTHTRYPVDVDITLRAFDYKFQQGDIFRSASQICDMFLYPNDPNTSNTLWAGDTFSKGMTSPDTAPSTTNITAWWKQNSFTADNERESPYNAIYSRITTKSNTYTVHWKVQTLKKTPGDPTKWTEGIDKVTGELRGSTLVERYIDPNTPLPDYATNTAPQGGAVQPMGYYYKWRVDLEKYFRPTP